MMRWWLAVVALGVVACGGDDFVAADPDDVTGGPGGAAGDGGASGDGGEAPGGTGTGGGAPPDGGAGGSTTISGAGGGPTGGGPAGGGPTGGAPTGGAPMGGMPPLGGGPSVALPTIPSGWDGPWIVWRGTDSETPPGCRSGNPPGISLKRGVSSVAASCGECPCTPDGATCGDAELTPYTGDSCDDGGSLVFDYSAFKPSEVNTCFSYSTTGWQNAAGNSYLAEFPLGSPGTCTFAKGSVTAPAPTWEGALEACRAPCSGDTCMLPAPPFDRAICVRQAGDVACPAAYPTRHLYFAEADDSRTCICDGVTCDVSCEGTFRLYADLDCSGATIDIAGSEEVCGTFPGQNEETVRMSLTALAPVCAPTTATAVGTVTQTMPETICCTE